MGSLKSRGIDAQAAVECGQGDKDHSVGIQIGVFIVWGEAYMIKQEGDKKNKTRTEDNGEVDVTNECEVGGWCRNGGRRSGVSMAAWVSVCWHNVVMWYR
jgi:hypothetical protein